MEITCVSTSEKDTAKSKQSQIYVSITGSGQFLGGGSIISRQWVLTSAKIFGSCSQAALRVNAGMRGYYWKGRSHQVRQIIKHPYYNKPTLGDDVGLIKIAGVFEFSDHLAPVCLPTKPLCPGLSGIATGWGTTSAGSPVISNWLQQVTLKTISALRCRYMNHLYMSLINRKMFCAGGYRGDTCTRDGGGPLVLIEKGHAVQYGITSWGRTCGHSKYPGVYVDVADYVPWIRMAIQGGPIYTLDNCETSA
ncbi:trypsin delta-like [Oratosquilla oratoria]|uniref:trypsin delta-like n=1 Tax=Oratosquilla oratoria TaxID=337810 RepID=UPI003F75A8B4